MKVHIIGVGTMGTAIITALRKNKGGYRIAVSERKSIKKDRLVSDFLIIAVKPQDITELSKVVADRISSASIIISIAAGVSLDRLRKLFKHQKTVRVMPNLALSVGEGIAAWKASGLNKREKKQVKKLLDCICDNFEVKKEKMIDAVTAVSGSGPAYFFFLAKNLEKAALSLGLDRSQARKLVKKTFSGAAALQYLGDYGDLIRRIASKRGTTEAALKIFEKNKTDRIIIKAVKQAYRRAKELGS